MTNVIQSFFDEHSQLVSVLEGEANLSLRLAVDRHFQKILIVATASYCEDLVKDAILDFASHSSGKNIEIISLIKSKAIERQYHTLFDWTTNSSSGTNRFWSLFGENQKKKVAAAIKREPSIVAKAEAFIQVGQLRNLLVHGNFGAMNVDLTIGEIRLKSELALGYIAFMRAQLVPDRPTDA
jgi:RiboL-PSP-HEPN